MSEFNELFEEINDNLNIKIAIFLFIIIVVVFSDLFNNIMFNYISGTKNELSNCPNTKGTLIQGVVVSCSYLLINLLNEEEII